jgi:hypothetical protein
MNNTLLDPGAGSLKRAVRKILLRYVSDDHCQVELARETRMLLDLLVGADEVS